MVRFDYRGAVVCAISRNATGVYANADYRKAGEVEGLWMGRWYSWYSSKMHKFIEMVIFMTHAQFYSIL